jgi:hypothetical protein
MWCDSFASCSVPAGRMHALALCLQRAGDGILREPVDFEARNHLAQLARDRDVAPRVPEADRGGDEQRPLAAV